MRKIIVFEHVSIDGYIADKHGKIDWAIRDEELTKFSQEGEETVDMYLFGRITYDMMASFWPTPMGKSVNPVFADILNKANKIVFSRTLKEATWENTEIVKHVDKEEIMKLKHKPGGNIMIFGSGILVSELAKLGLIDDYQLLVNPVVLGEGKPLFKNLPEMISLKLIRAKEFKSGVTFLHYQPK